MSLCTLRDFNFFKLFTVANKQMGLHLLFIKENEKEKWEMDST